MGGDVFEPICEGFGAGEGVAKEEEGGDNNVKDDLDVGGKEGEEDLEHVPEDDDSHYS